MYDFDIGDEFHYKSRFSYGYGPGSYSESTGKIVRIIGKEVFGNTDSIIYQAEECINHKVFPHSSSVVITLTHDTVDIRCRFAPPQDDTLRVRMPGEYAPYPFSPPWNTAGEILRYTTGPYGRQIQVIHPNGFYAQSPSRCFEKDYTGSPRETYGQGLGKMGYMVYNLIYNEWDYDSLTFYKKGNEEWGIPVAEDCNALLTAIEDVQHPGWSVTILPNPAHDVFHVVVKGPAPVPAFQISIMDLSGRVVFRTWSKESPLLVNRLALPDGLYIWQVTCPETTQTGKLVLE